MKSKLTRDQEQNRKPRRFRLNRETILDLNDLKLQGLAGGAGQNQDPFPCSVGASCCATGSTTHQSG